MTRSGRTVLVLGAQGVLGSVLAGVFTEEGWAVLRAGRRPEAGVRLVDLDRPETLHETLDGVDLVPPLGTRTCFEVGAEERGWLSEDVLGEREVRLGVYFRERALQGLFRSLNALRLIAGTPRVTFVAGRGRVPAEATREPICEWVGVKRGGQRLAARASHRHGDYRMTAASTVAFGQALLEVRSAEPSQTGVFAPEEL